MRICRIPNSLDAHWNSPDFTRCMNCGFTSTLSSVLKVTSVNHLKTVSRWHLLAFLPNLWVAVFETVCDTGATPFEVFEKCNITVINFSNLRSSSRAHGILVHGTYCENLGPEKWCSRPRYQNLPGIEVCFTSSVGFRRQIDLSQILLDAVLSNAPMASGYLVCCLEVGCKFSRVFEIRNGVTKDMKKDKIKNGYVVYS